MYTRQDDKYRNVYSVQRLGPRSMINAKSIAGHVTVLEGTPFFVFMYGNPEYIYT